MTHPLLEQLALQRRDEMADRARAHRPTPAETAAPAKRRTATRRSGSLSRLAALMSRA
jgi:hypothetical protein